MKNLWNNKTALKYISEYKKKNINKDLALRIYTTHLLGKNPKLVLHGGGNSSVKSQGKNLFNKNVNLIYEILEPEAPNSFVSWGVIKANLNSTLPIYRIPNNLNNEK